MPNIITDKRKTGNRYACVANCQKKGGSFMENMNQWMPGKHPERNPGLLMISRNDKDRYPGIRHLEQGLKSPDDQA